MLFENFTKKRETENAICVEIFIPELDKNYDVWFPNSKITIDGTTIICEDEFWEEKIEELKNPTQPESITFTLSEDSVEKKDKSTKIILDCVLKSLKFKCWLFIPNSLILDEGLDTEKDDNYFITIPKWFWKKSSEELINSQLEFYNQSREEENKFSKSDFKFKNKID